MVPKQFILFSAETGGDPVKIFKEEELSEKQVKDNLFELANDLDDLSDMLPGLRKDLRCISWQIRSVVIGRPYIPKK